MKPILVGLLAGALAWFAVMAAAFSHYPMFPTFADAVATTGLSFAIAMGLPPMVGGWVVARFAKRNSALWIGLGGIVLGAPWHLHLAVLSADVANASNLGSGALVGLARGGGSPLAWIMNLEYVALNPVAIRVSSTRRHQASGKSAGI